MAKKRNHKLTQKTTPISHIDNAVWGMLLLTLSTLILLSLLSFGYGHASHNWLGMLGYTLGGLFYYSLGLGSYILAAFVGWAGWRKISSQPINRPLVKFFACIGLIVSLGLLLNVFESLYPALGDFFGNRLRAKDGPILM